MSLPLVVTIMHRALLRQQINALAQVRGQHTELISLYIPGRKRVADVIFYLTKEATASANIKDKANRKAVLAGITSLVS